MKKTILFFLIFCTNQAIMYSQKVITWELQETLSAAELRLRLFGFDIDYGIEAYGVTYEAFDTDGSLDTASGLVVLPVSGEENQQFPFLVYQHGTVDNRESVPSRLGVQERFLPYYFAGQGYHTIAPDYLGLGDSRRTIHPYIHADSEASAAKDLLVSTQKQLTESGIPYHHQLFLTGYSQGGHASMALHERLEAAPIDGLDVTAGSHMSGIYNVSGEITQASFSEQPYFFPAYPVWIILSYQSVYGNLYNQLSDIFWEDIVTEIEQFSKEELPLFELNDILINKLESTYGASIPKYLFKENFLNDFQTNSDHPFRLALQDNDVYDWVPATPMRMMYCQKDEQVSYTNATFTDSLMNVRGAADVKAININPNGNHGDCVIPATLATADFFETFAERPIAVSTRDLAIEAGIKVYPNPAADYLEIQFSNHLLSGVSSTLQNIAGQTVQRFPVFFGKKMTIPLNDVPAGLYLLNIQSKDQIWTQKIVIK